MQQATVSELVTGLGSSQTMPTIKVALYQQVHVVTTLNHLTVQMYKGEPTMMISDGMQGDAEYNRTSTVIKMDNQE